MMADASFQATWLRRSQESADRTMEILRLPIDLPWIDVQLEFGLETPAQATLVIQLTADQVHALIDLGVERP